MDIPSLTALKIIHKPPQRGTRHIRTTSAERMGGGHKPVDFLPARTDDAIYTAYARRTRTEPNDVAHGTAGPSWAGEGANVV